MSQPEAAGIAIPSIYRDRSFWGITLTQFFAVFNDNFYKQIVLFICLDLAASGTYRDLQGLALIVFSLPFILFSGICGYLSDLISKRTIVLVTKVAEIIIMVVGLYAFLQLDVTLMMIVLFLMGAHSALFAPAKYGLLPELFTENQLPRVNGLFQMSMFMSIILGLSLAGVVMTSLRALPSTTQTTVISSESRITPDAGTPDLAPLSEPSAALPTGGVTEHLWLASAICILLAVIGICCAMLIRKTPAARPGLKFDWTDLILNRETRKLIWADKRLLSALLATSGFWATGGLVYPLAINKLGRQQYLLTEQQTSFMAAGTGLGIAAGCVLGMILSNGFFNARLIRVGSLGMFLGLIALASPGPFHGTLLGVPGSAAMLIWLGICAGLYNVPLQVVIQARAPVEHKGRVIGAMNLANWIGIYSSGLIYSLVNPLIETWKLPNNLLFGVGALFFLPIILLYRPRSEALSESRTPQIAGAASSPEPA